MIEKEELNKLNKLFYNDKNFLLGFNKFYEKVKQNGISITKAELLKYYNHQEVSQRFKPKETKITFKIVNSSRPFEKIYCDSMYVTDLNITLLSFIDLYSKYAFVFSFKLSKQLQSYKSAQSLIKVIDFIK